MQYFEWNTRISLDGKEIDDMPDHIYWHQKDFDEKIQKT